MNTSTPMTCICAFRTRPSIFTAYEYLPIFRTRKTRSNRSALIDRMSSGMNIGRKNGSIARRSMIARGVAAYLSRPRTGCA